MCSIYSASRKGYHRRREIFGIRPVGGLPTEKLKDFYNKKFLHVGGCETVNASDDSMAQIYDITYQLDGGKSNRNPSYYTAVSDNIELTEPIKKVMSSAAGTTIPNSKAIPLPK